MIISLYGMYALQYIPEAGVPGLTSRCQSYTASYDHEGYVFAVHESCLALLARLLTGSLDINLLDKTSLYNTLDYHAIDGLHFSTDPNYEHWQSWESRPGDEVWTYSINS